jgi:L-threonylcarbamoyladenylate synthase
LDPLAVAKIFKLKQRPAQNPIIVHVASAAMARRCAARWPPLANVLGSAFWPGPLTLVVEKSTEIPEIVTANGQTVGIRWPQHPFMQAVIRHCDFPVAAPSANLANHLSPTRASHVQEQLGGQLRLIIDGGECAVGIESTVVDVTGPTPVVLRPGMISEPALLRAAGFSGTAAVKERLEREDSQAKRSPGQFLRHYSPRARLLLWSWNNETDLAKQLSAARARVETTFILAHTHIPISGRFPHVMLIPDDPEAFGRALYAELHRCDSAGAELIVVEAPPNTPEWAGITDRLKRASA